MYLNTGLNQPLTIALAVPRKGNDSRLRAWVKVQVRGQQPALGKALQDAGLVKQGQVWVSNYITGGPATATIDHLEVIAGFFERSFEEMLSEAGSDLLRHSGDQRSKPHQGGALDVPASDNERRELLELRATVEAYAAALDKTEHVARNLIEIAAVRQQGRRVEAQTAGRRGRGRKAG